MTAAPVEEAVGAQMEDVWRRESPRVLAALLRKHGDFSDCEDAAQEALAAATEHWPIDGLPDDPGAWLIRVAHRRLVDQHRADRARATREERAAVSRPDDAETAPAADQGPAPGSSEDDDLLLLLLCCHPALTRPSQVALTLRAVGGLSTTQIAAAFLVPETTMAQRLSRAKATLRAAGSRFELPPVAQLPARVAAVLDVLYLVFNEGYTRTSGPWLHDTFLAEEGIRLTRALYRSCPDHDEVAGALALMLLTHARHPARIDARGDLVPLAEQDRSRWDRSLVDEGVGILETALRHGHVGRYQLEAAIAAVHDESATAAATDWAQIAALYGMLARVAPSAVVTLNQAVAVGMADGPNAGLRLLQPLLEDRVMGAHHRTHAVRAHLLEMAGDRAAARAAYLEAARLTASMPEQRYLNRRAEAVRDAVDGRPADSPK